MTDPQDEGSGTVLVLAVVGLVLTLTVAVAALLQAAAARHRAQAAADLAALAAAQDLMDGRATPCESAQRVVRENGAELVSCDGTGQEATVVTRVDVDGFLTHLGPATAKAHAGPGRTDEP